MGKGRRGEAAASPKIWAEPIFKEVAFHVRIFLLDMLVYVSASYDPRFFSTVS